MNGYTIFRLSCLTLLWLLLCWMVVAYQPFTPRVGFIIVASGVVVFVPVYKKLKKKSQDAK